MWVSQHILVCCLCIIPSFLFGLLLPAAAAAADVSVAWRAQKLLLLLLLLPKVDAWSCRSMLLHLRKLIFGKRSLANSSENYSESIRVLWICDHNFGNICRIYCQNPSNSVHTHFSLGIPTELKRKKSQKAKMQTFNLSQASLHFFLLKIESSFGFWSSGKQGLTFFSLSLSLSFFSLFVPIFPRYEYFSLAGILVNIIKFFFLENPLWSNV